jgi:hypothetical protein
MALQTTSDLESLNQRRALYTKTMTSLFGQLMTDVCKVIREQVEIRTTIEESTKEMRQMIEELEQHKEKSSQIFQEDYIEETDLRVLITILCVFHKTHGLFLPLVDFTSDDKQIMSVWSEPGIRRIPEIYGPAFSMVVTKSMITHKLLPRLRTLKMEGAADWSCYFPFHNKSDKTLMIPLVKLLPFIKQEFQLIANGQSLLKPVVLENISAFVIPEIPEEKLTRAKLRLTIAKKLGMVTSHARKIVGMTNDQLHAIEQVMERRNYANQNATAAKLQDPAFQKAAAMIAQQTHGAAPPHPNIEEIYDGHWTHRWEHIQGQETYQPKPEKKHPLPTQETAKKKRKVL